MGQIPKNLPQFEKYPTLFITSGEFDARFFLALNGIINEEKRIRMNPKEESAVSHHERYIEDLKKKFQKKVHFAIHDFIATYKLKEIYIFAPQYVTNMIMAGLDKSEQKKIKMKFFEELTKYNALQMVRIFWNESQRAVKSPESIKNNEKKILEKPMIKKALHKT